MLLWFANVLWRIQKYTFWMGFFVCLFSNSGSPPPPKLQATPWVTSFRILRIFYVLCELLLSHTLLFLFNEEYRVMLFWLSFLRSPIFPPIASSYSPSYRPSPFYVIRYWLERRRTCASWAACCCTSATWRGPTSGRQTTPSQDSAPDADVPASATAVTRTPNRSEFMRFRRNGLDWNSV